MRTVFVGAVQGSRVGLEALERAGLAPALVVTLPPDRAGRHSDYVDLAAPASALGIQVFHTADVNSAPTIAAIAATAPDLCLVIGWSQICGRPFRSVARLGAIGFHPAPLPRMRGRAVIPWTILQGETETGATLFWLDEGVDSGDIILQRTYPVADDETARSLYDRHLAALAEMLPEALRRARDGDAPRIPQDPRLATWCAKRRREDGRIDWRAPAAETLRLIRAVGDPYPGAFTVADGVRITIDEATLVADSHKFVGLPGQVQRLDGMGFAVKCGDGACIEVRRWRAEGGRGPKLHAKLDGGGR